MAEGPRRSKRIIAQIEEAKNRELRPKSPPPPPPPKKEKKPPKPKPEKPPSPPPLTDAEVKENMRAVAEEIHRPARRNYETRMVIVNNKDTTWGADLADMGTWKAENNGHNQILTVIDVFTRYAWAVALKSKEAGEVRDAFDKIVKESGRKPKHLWTDQGTEFKNKKLKAWREEHDITLYHTYGQGKSAIVERFNRTLKTIMWRELDARNTKDWVSMLPELLEKYNNNPHGSLKITLTPTQAGQYEQLVRQIWNDKAAEKEEADTSKPRFKVGDTVRVSRQKGLHEKGYDQNWGRETYTVSAVLDTAPVTYKVTDHLGEVLAGSFYNEEMMSTNLENMLVEKVIKKRGKLSYVKWMGLPASHNSWVETSTMLDA